MNALKAGAFYFAAVFAVGSALGIVRVFMLVPAFGEFYAVLIELPVILAASWILCRRISGKLGVSENVAARLVMGLAAFSLLMAAEFLLARYGFDRTFSEQLSEYAHAPGALGLAGQVIYALFPLIQLYVRV